MIQKTLTIDSKRYTAKQINAYMLEDRMTTGGDYIIRLHGRVYYANYRMVQQDDLWAPVCNRPDANAIALMPNDGSYKWSIWLWL